MNERKPTDHWNILAVKLGAKPAVEPEEEQELPKLPPPAELSWGEQPVEQATEPEPLPEIESSFQPEQVEIIAPARHIPKPAPPQVAEPKPKRVNHWRELANALGIEVTEPEPEPEPEPELEPEPETLLKPALVPVPAPVLIPAPVPAQEVVQEPDAVAIETQAVTPPEIPAWSLVRGERPGDVAVSERTESRREHRRSSLFEDPNLSLDTPGVLDAIFDEVDLEAEIVSEPATDRGQPEARTDELPRSERPRSELPRSELPRSELPRSELPRSERPRSERPRSERPRRERWGERRGERRDEVRRDEVQRDEVQRDEVQRDEVRRDEVRRDEVQRDEPFVPRERDFGFFDEPADQMLDEVSAYRGEFDAVGELDEPDVDSPDAAQPEAEEEDKSGRRRGRRRRRGGRRTPRSTTDQTRIEAGAEAGVEDLEDDEEEQEVIAGPSRGAAEIQERRVPAEAEGGDDLEDEAEDHFDDDDEEQDGGDRLRLKHKKIPTWQQAIDAILAANLESRSKNPGGGGGRGRGRRWRR